MIDCFQYDAPNPAWLGADATGWITMPPCENFTPSEYRSGDCKMTIENSIHL